MLVLVVERGIQKIFPVESWICQVFQEGDDFCQSIKDLGFVPLLVCLHARVVFHCRERNEGTKLAERCTSDIPRSYHFIADGTKGWRRTLEGSHFVSSVLSAFFSGDEDVIFLSLGLNQTLEVSARQDLRPTHSHCSAGRGGADSSAPAVWPRSAGRSSSSLT